MVVLRIVVAVLVVAACTRARTEDKRTTDGGSGASVQPPTDAEDPTCGGFTYYREDKPCCAGMSRIRGGLQPDGTCGATRIGGHEAVCTPCGDGKCQWVEDRCNCPQDCEGRAIDYEGSRKLPARPAPILYSNDTSGDYPTFRAALERARATRDVSICDGLPEPVPQTFDQGDHMSRSPKRAGWYAYCRALVADSPGACPARDVQATPNLNAACEYFFQAVAAAADPSPGGCIREIGRTLHSSDEVRNCMLPAFGATFGNYRSTAETDVAASLGPFTRAELDFFHCANLPWGKDRDQCISAVAVATGNDLLCSLTSRHRCD
jgi:hypothetical protein